LEPLAQIIGIYKTEGAWQSVGNDFNLTTNVF